MCYCVCEDCAYPIAWMSGCSRNMSTLSFCIIVDNMRAVGTMGEQQPKAFQEEEVNICVQMYYFPPPHCYIIYMDSLRLNVNFVFKFSFR